MNPVQYTSQDPVNVHVALNADSHHAVNVSLDVDVAPFVAAPMANDDFQHPVVAEAEAPMNDETANPVAQAPMADTSACAAPSVGQKRKYLSNQ